MCSSDLKLKNATNSMTTIFETAKKLVDDMWKDEAIRLVGLGVDDLTYESIYQPSIFDKSDDHLNDRSLNDAVDKIKNKYGYNAIGKASMRGKKKISKKY